MLLLLLLFSCADPPAAHEQLLTVVHSDAPNEQRLAECDAVQDATLREECIAMLSTSDLQACDGVPESRARDDCWFRRAEANATQGEPDVELAWSLCQRAGRLAGPCRAKCIAAHLNRSLDIPVDLEQDYDTVEALAGKWAAVTGSDAAHSEVWKTSWTRFHHDSPRLAACPAQEGPRRRSCTEAFGSEYALYWQRAVRADPQRWCKQTLPGAEVLPGVAVDMSLRVGTRGREAILLSDLLVRSWKDACR